MILDVARCYLWLFTLYINIKIGKKKLLNVRLTGDHLFGKLLFTWLSLVMSMMVSFCAVLFPRDVLEEILNLIGSVSEGFPSYSFIKIVQMIVRGQKWVHLEANIDYIHLYKGNLK